MPKPSPKFGKVFTEADPAGNDEVVRLSYLNARLAALRTEITGGAAAPNPTPPPGPTPTPAFVPDPTLLAGRVFSLDPSLPTQTTALGSSAAMQLDAAGNIMGLYDPVAGVVIPAGYGRMSLVAPDSTFNRKPYFRGSSQSFNTAYDSFSLPVSLVQAVFGTPGAPWMAQFVIRQTGAGSNGILNFRTGGPQVIVYGNPGATDGSLRIEQNNTTAFGSEPSGAANVLNQDHVLTILCDGATLSVYRGMTRTFQTPEGAMGGLPAGTAALLLNNPQADVAIVNFFNVAPSMSQLTAEIQRLGAKYAVATPGSVTQGPSAAIAAPGTGSGNTVVQAYVQTKHIPSGPPLRQDIKPQGLNVPATSNIGWWKFSSTDTSANVRTRATLDGQFWYRNMFGDPNSPNTSPTNGIPSNWKAVYADYPATLADGVTPDPRDLMPIMPDGIYLKARKRLATSSDSAMFEMAQLRLLTEFRPGDILEMRARMPSQRRSAGSKWSWPTFWTFSGWQDWVTQTRYYCQPGTGLEFDIKDTYQNQGERQGTVINHGVVLYNGDTSVYHNPSTAYIANHPDFLARNYASNALRVFPAPEVDPTEGFHTYTMQWDASNERVVFLVDGIVTWIHNVHSPAINKSAPTVDGNGYSNPGYDLGPFDPAREGTPLGQFIQVSHQFGVMFNGGDMLLLDQAAAAGDVVADPMVVDYIGHWRANATITAPAILPETASPTLEGKTYTWTNKGDARAYSGPGSLAIVAPSVGHNEQMRILTRPMEAATGTWTAKLCPIYPGVDYWNGGIVLRNSTTGKLTYTPALYPKPTGSYMGVATADNPQVPSSTLYGGLQDHGFLRLNEYGQFRVVVTSTDVTVWGSSTGEAGTWEQVGTPVPASAAGAPNEVGFFLNPVEIAGAPPGEMRAAFVRYSPGTDPQAATPAQ